MVNNNGKIGPSMKQERYEALKQLRDRVPALAELLKLGNEVNIGFWTHIVDAKLLCRLSPDFPIVAAICGGGSSGKSTLFNSLLGEQVAPTGGTAGMNRRVLFAVPAERARQSTLIADLAAPFKSVPEPLHDPQALTVPGKPLFVLSQRAPENLVLLDTPDFDTGARGSYTNREVTRMALEASDILIYIFTNSNYNNRDNTDFIAQMLTGIGKRKCILIYRVYPSFSEQEVLQHAMTVARGIYGNPSPNDFLGIYRADEDNRIAAGQRFMELRPVQAGHPTFAEVLQSIDAPKLRFELFASILADVLERAEAILEVAQASRDELRLALDALQMAQSLCVHDALKHFPMDRIMREFAQIWAKTDPPHVKMMRKTGSVIEFPLKMILGAAGWAKNQLFPEEAGRSSSVDFEKKLDEDLVTAVTRLHYQAVSPQLSVAGSFKDPVVANMADAVARLRARNELKIEQNPRVETSGDGTTLTFAVDAHPVTLPEQQKLRDKDFKSVLQSILKEKHTIVDISREMAKDLQDLADHFRDKMGFLGKISQTFWAFLNVLPATVAVTYVLSTGDPVGAAGIKIKLAGLFGAKDLYALLAIPVTTGLKKADRKQIEEMLGPIVQSWLNHKLKTVQHLFEEKITGGIIRSAQEHIAAADELIGAIRHSMAICANPGTGAMEKR
jgi:hypothetical protein